MSNIRLIGLESIEIGTIPDLMHLKATLATITAIVPDSAHLIIETPGVTDLYVEDTDLPDITIIGTSKKSVEFATRDIGTAILVHAFSGTPSGTTIWKSPVTAIVVKERGLRLTSKAFGKVKMVIELPRVNVRCGGDLRFTKTESGQINFVCDVLIPASSSVIPPMKIREAAE